MKRRTVISMEQALSLPYATLRFVQLGWRVIRIEATPSGKGNPGDPNRYIGAKVVDDDRHSYFIAPNVGKEAITLNLKEPEGQAVLQRLIRDLDADVFTCNTIPGRYEQLGIDYDTLKAAKPDLIWAGISAMGPEYPKVPGYDPAIQAMAGYMEVTGMTDGPPTLMGLPLIDLKAGDEVYAGVCLALAEKAETGQGKRIDVSMLQAAASWLITTLPLIDFDCDPSEVTRSGNEHRKFVPTSAYQTSDGFIYVAMGSDAQWRRFTEIPKFTGLANDDRATNNGRNADRIKLFADIAEVMKNYPTAEIAADLAAAVIPNAPINTIPQALENPAIGGRVTTTTTPSGQTIRMQPMAVDVEGATTDFAFSPKYGEHTDAVLAEVGYTAEERSALREAGIAT